MRRKFFLIALALVLLAGLVACGEGTSTAPGGNEANENEQANEAAVKEITIDEQLLLDRDGIVITATGLEETWLGPEINILIENNSGQPLTVQARNTSVNGYMVEPVFSCDVAPGKKANDSITFTGSDLQKCGIEVIARVELVFHVFNTDSWATVFDSEPVVIETSAAGTYTQEYDTSGTVVFDEAGFKIIFKGIAESMMGPEAVLYIENNSAENITVQARNTSVNGYMVEPIFSCDVVQGKKAVDSLSFFEEDLAKNGIEKIEEIELYFHIFNTESWNTILDTETIKITVQ
ncbi:MAG TPA: hypothetical protein GXZ53_01075 [Firmicutes bacterium]|jgi:hypothetical protein|nr:hypothetical protein [Bacillota bacterium]